MTGQFKIGYNSIGLALQGGPAAMSIDGDRPAFDEGSGDREVILIEFETGGGSDASADTQRTGHFELALPDETPFANRISIPTEADLARQVDFVGLPDKAYWADAGQFIFTYSNARSVAADLPASYTTSTLTDFYDA